ncbi:MAG: helix-turn-helix domain-containing protein [Methylococcales bacterium]|nr:helix-turn-helix domain-containing protein [Methylococcales bacterium]
MALQINFLILVLPHLLISLLLLFWLAVDIFFLMQYLIISRVGDMLYIKNITVEEKVTLEEMKKNHPSRLTRQRAHAILLTVTGFDIREIAKIFDTCRQTAATWVRGWERKGIVGLFDKPRSGRSRKAACH